MGKQPGQIIMTKTLTIILAFFSTIILGQTYSGALRLQVYEKTKGDPGKQIVANQTVTVVLNESTILSLTTDNAGYISTIKNLPVGKYNVKIIRIDCQAYEVNGIVIGEGKTAYVTFLLTCTSYINTLTKKEKKKLGYK